MAHHIEDAKMRAIERAQAERIRPPQTPALVQINRRPITPYTSGSKPRDLQRALALAGARVAHLQAEMRQLRADSPAAAHASGGKENVAGVADTALSGGADGDGGGGAPATTWQDEALRLRAQRLQRGARHAAAAKRREATGRRPSSAVPVDSRGWDADGRRWRGRRASAASAPPPDIPGKPSREFLKCRKVARSLGLRSVAEWHEYNRSGVRQHTLPADPHRHFAGQGWLNYADWLGLGPNAALAPTGAGLELAVAGAAAGDAPPGGEDDLTAATAADTFVATIMAAEPPPPGFQDARRAARWLGLSRDFLRHVRHGTISRILALAPEAKAFRSNTDSFTPQLLEVLRYIEEAELAAAYSRWVKSPAREPSRVIIALPARPDLIYTGFNGPFLTWRDFLGVPEAATGTTRSAGPAAADATAAAGAAAAAGGGGGREVARQITTTADTNSRHGGERLKYDAARRVVRGLGLRSQREWIECVRDGGVPAGVPSDPNRSFAAEWRSWADFLGCQCEWC